MRPYSFALLGFCLFCAAASWATEDVQSAEPGEAEAPAADERPALPERSVSDAQTLEQRLDKREQQMLQAGAESFLALWLPANVGDPSGAVILVPGDVENADGAAAVGPLRRKLPDAGWHSLSLTLPDPDGDPLPLRSAAVAPAEGETSTTESAPASEPAVAAPADGGTPQPEGSAVSPEQRRQAHAERVMARIDAAIAFAAQQQASQSQVVAGCQQMIASADQTWCNADNQPKYASDAASHDGATVSDTFRTQLQSMRAQCPDPSLAPSLQRLDG